MTQHSDETRLRHMLDYAVEAIDLVRARSREDLDRDRQLNLSLVRLIEIVGEAASRVSTPTRDRLGSIVWPEIIGLRNRLIHAYDDVDFDVLWQIVHIDLPPLVLQLREALGEGEGG